MKLWSSHDDIIKWKHFPRYWPFVRGIHRSTVISPHQDHWRGALMFFLISAWINGWVNNREAGDLRRNLHLNKRLSKQPWGWLFESLFRPMWRHRNETSLVLYIESTLIPMITLFLIQQHQSNLIPALISKHMPSKAWVKFTYSFTNFNGNIMEVWQRISNSIPHLIMVVIIFHAVIKLNRC